MKKYNFFFVLIFTCFVFSCGNKETSNTNTVNNDAVGEADTSSPYNAKASASLIKATINGQEIEFKFMDAGIEGDIFTFTQSADGKYTILDFLLASTEKMKEKIGIRLINHSFGRETMPFTVPKGKQEGKLARIDLDIQKSNVFINYNNENDFICAITSITDNEIEGNFMGEVKNIGGKVIKIENGTFKIKIKKIEMKVQ
jgi:hypothetical protein